MKRVLVCEDEDSIREFVVINLVRSGYEVVDVNCGEDALKAYDEKDGGFDVALLDIMMPLHTRNAGGQKALVLQ